jgi:hypothetical protein
MKHRPTSTHGFALVIALSLMAFILLLILSITTLVRVETQSANIQLAQLEARMNAQLGAMVALGDLQRYTGPDQRVTALTGTLDQIRRVAKLYRVYYKKSDPSEAENYLMDHSSIMYVLSPEGEYINHFGPEVTPAQIVAFFNRTFQ